MQPWLYACELISILAVIIFFTYSLIATYTIHAYMYATHALKMHDVRDI